jgi:hypothetical protein
MNSNVSLHWLEIVFPFLLTVILGASLWRQSPPWEGLLDKVGLAGLIIALASASVANLFYQRVLDARAWPTVGIYDQVVVSSTGDIFVKVRDPIMGRADRVQRYSCRGDFINAFLPNNAGGLYKIAVNLDGTLSIYSVRTDSIDTFSFEGKFLQSRDLDSRQMPFKFLKKGPSITEANGCSLTRDPASGRLAAKDSIGIWPLERGDWVLEYGFSRRNIFGAALLGGLALVFSFVRKINKKPI